jgi:hypothetical protein
MRAALLIALLPALAFANPKKGKIIDVKPMHPRHAKAVKHAKPAPETPPPGQPGPDLTR